MSIRLRIVRSTQEKAQVYRLRYRVFVDEEQRFPIPADHIVDRYDSFEETTNILAFSDGEPVAGIRVTLDNPAGLPVQDAFDFLPFQRTLAGGCASIGWLCIRQRYRRNPGLVVSLIQMCFREMRKRGVRHVLSVLHPPVLPLLERLVGARAVAPEFLEHRLQVPMVPMHVDLDRLPPGSRERFADPEKGIFDDATERRLFRKGEVIFSRGNAGTEVFQIMRGVVRTESAEAVFCSAGSENGREPHLLLGPGQIFGELSALDGGKRTVTLVAHSDEVDVMVWDRATVHAQLRATPERMFELLRLMAGRLRHAIQGRITNPSAALAARLLVDASRRGSHPVDVRWLARQCGLDRKSLKRMVMPWEENRWIQADSKQENIRVINGGRLAQEAGML